MGSFDMSSEGRGRLKTANEGVRDLLGAVVFFVALVSFLSLLVRQMSWK
jgi:hypothetical protein